MEQEFDFKQFVIRYGLLLGLINLIFGLLGYLGGIKLLVSWWFGIVVFLIGIGLLVFAGIKMRKGNGGYLSLKEGFVGLVTIFAISALISTVFNLVLFNVIDPDLPVALKEGVMETTVETMERFNAPEEVIEQQLIELETMDENYRPAGLVKSYLFLLIFGAIISLIIAAIIKKKKPDFEFQE